MNINLDEKMIKYHIYTGIWTETKGKKRGTKKKRIIFELKRIVVMGNINNYILNIYLYIDIYLYMHGEMLL
jgi:hypothetical protein